MSETKNIISNSTKNIMMHDKDGTRKHDDLLQSRTTESLAALEIQNIEIQQSIIIQRMVNLEVEKQKLKNLLKVVRSLDSTDDESDDDDQRVRTA